MEKETEDKQRKRRAKLFGKDGKKDGKKYDKTKGKTVRMPEMHITGEKPNGPVSPSVKLVPHEFIEGGDVKEELRVTKKNETRATRK